MAPSLFVELVTLWILNLWPSLSDHCLLCVKEVHKTLSLPPVDVIYWVYWRTVAALLLQHLFICESDSSPCNASNLAHEISVCSLCCHANQFNRDRGMAGHPQTHMQTSRRRTQHHHSPLKSQMMAQDWCAGDSFSCESTWGIQWSVFSQRVGGRGGWGYRHKGNEGVRRRKLERCIVHTVHIADVSSIHLLCCKKSRSLIFFPPLLFHIVSQDVCGAEFRWLIQSTIRL